MMPFLLWWALGPVASAASPDAAVAKDAGTDNIDIGVLNNDASAGVVRAGVHCGAATACQHSSAP